MRQWTSLVLRHARARIFFAILLLSLQQACQTTQSPVYLVKLEPGDTLAAIAAKYDTSWKDIVKLNNLRDARDLSAGRVIRVMPGPGGHAANEAKLARMNSSSDGSVRKLASGKRNKGKQAKASAGKDADIPELELMPDSPVPGKANGRRRGGLLFGGGGDEANARLHWPVVGEVSSFFGPRHGRRHEGIDIRAQHGTPVLAAAAGRVTYAGRMQGYGRIVIMQHQGLRTYYAHLNSISVDKGDQLAIGDELGEVGTSGNARGPHLHFEVRDNRNKAFDPLTALPSRELYSKN